jgi:hypothetical protein
MSGLFLMVEFFLVSEGEKGEWRRGGKICSTNPPHIKKEPRSNTMNFISIGRNRNEKWGPKRKKEKTAELASSVDQSD